jgi:GGDEF domain-containing protein
MLRRERFASAGLWLTCGGLVVLAAHQMLAVYEPELSVDNLTLLAGALAGYFVTAVGVYLMVRSSSLGRSPRSEANVSAVVAPAEQAVPAWSDTCRRMLTSFLAWCEEELPDANLWNSFDRLVREMLVEEFGAVRVRCYQVLPGNQQLRSLSQMEKAGEGEADGKCARTGILGHVATTGQEYVAADPGHGKLVEQLAADADEPWDWVLPVREGGQTAGLVAVGKLSSTTSPDRTARQEVAALLTAFWKHVRCVEQLQIAERTDKASGLLTRGDFFEAAKQALADSYRENEPVVMAVLALEGLRGLDDVGRWRDRDALVETVGQLFTRRIRTDDVIGRFSDDRFVMLLRRLDSGLGKLIATKLQNTAEERIAQFGELSDGICVRAGLAGSGFQQRPLEGLLIAAFDALEAARKQDVTLHYDLGAGADVTATAKAEPAKP